jgi:hypothetical protein
VGQVHGLIASVNGVGWNGECAAVARWIDLIWFTGVGAWPP